MTNKGEGPFGFLAERFDTLRANSQKKPPIQQKETDREIVTPGAVFGAGHTGTVQEQSEINKKSPTIHAISEMQDAAVSLCVNLNVSSSVFNSEDWISTLEKHQKEESFRLNYFCVTQYVFDNEIEGEKSGFLTNLDSAVELAQQKYIDDEESIRLYKMALKFKDHVNLAIQQKRLVNKTQKEMLKEVEGIVSPRINEMTREMTSQLVGMISIFTALSFVVFGGISSMDSLMKALQETTKNQESIIPTIIVGIAWSFCMLNLLFAFMYFVIRITKLPKPVDENAQNVVQRYPVVFLANYILLAMFLIFGAFWFAECNGIGRGIFEEAIQNEERTFWVGAFVIVGALVLLGVILIYKFKKNKE